MALICYNPVFIAISYIFSAIFISIRSSFLLTSKVEWARFNLFLYVCFISAYILGRRFTQFKRERFIQNNTLKNAVNMFHSLLRMFHDGILLSESDNILFANQTLEKIFDLDSIQK